MGYLTRKELAEIEEGLSNKGIPQNILNIIHKSKILIIDDGADDLKGLYDSLRSEGFNLLTKLKKCIPIEQLLKDKYDLLLLDLNDVAVDICEDDGLGYLENLKSTAPTFPVIVITGQNIPVGKTHIIDKADYVLKKPVMANDLATDVRQLLFKRQDRFFASLEIIKELDIIDTELRKNLGIVDRFLYGYKRKGVEKRLKNNKDDILVKVEGLIDIVKTAKGLTNKVELIFSNIKN